MARFESGVEESDVGFTKEEAKENWEDFKAGIKPWIAEKKKDFGKLKDKLIEELEVAGNTAEEIWAAIQKFLDKMI